MEKLPKSFTAAHSLADGAVDFCNLWSDTKFTRDYPGAILAHGVVCFSIPLSLFDSSPANLVDYNLKPEMKKMKTMIFHLFFYTIECLIRYAETKSEDIAIQLKPFNLQDGGTPPSDLHNLYLQSGGHGSSGAFGGGGGESVPFPRGSSPSSLASAFGNFLGGIVGGSAGRPQASRPQQQSLYEKKDAITVFVESIPCPQKNYVQEFQCVTFWVIIHDPSLATMSNKLFLKIIEHNKVMQMERSGSAQSSGKDRVPSRKEGKVRQDPILVARGPCADLVSVEMWKNLVDIHLGLSFARENEKEINARPISDPTNPVAFCNVFSPAWLALQRMQGLDSKALLQGDLTESLVTCYCDIQGYFRTVESMRNWDGSSPDPSGNTSSRHPFPTTTTAAAAANSVGWTGGRGGSSLGLDSTLLRNMFEEESQPSEGELEGDNDGGGGGRGRRRPVTPHDNIRGGGRERGGAGENGEEEESSSQQEMARPTILEVQRRMVENIAPSLQQRIYDSLDRRRSHSSFRGDQTSSSPSVGRRDVFAGNDVGNVPRRAEEGSHRPRAENGMVRSRGLAPNQEDRFSHLFPDEESQSSGAPMAGTVSSSGAANRGSEGHGILHFFRGRDGRSSGGLVLPSSERPMYFTVPLREHTQRLPLTQVTAAVLSRRGFPSAWKYQNHSKIEILFPELHELSRNDAMILFLDVASDADFEEMAKIIFHRAPEETEALAPRIVSYLRDLSLIELEMRNSLVSKDDLPVVREALGAGSYAKQVRDVRAGLHQSRQKRNQLQKKGRSGLLPDDRIQEIPREGTSLERELAFRLRSTAHDAILHSGIPGCSNVQFSMGGMEGEKELKNACVQFSSDHSHLTASLGNSGQSVNEMKRMHGFSRVLTSAIEKFLSDRQMVYREKDVMRQSFLKDMMDHWNMLARALPHVPSVAQFAVLLQMFSQQRTMYYAVLEAFRGATCYYKDLLNEARKLDLFVARVERIRMSNFGSSQRPPLGDREREKEREGVERTVASTMAEGEFSMGFEENDVGDSRESSDSSTFSGFEEEEEREEDLQKRPKKDGRTVLEEKNQSKKRKSSAADEENVRPMASSFSSMSSDSISSSGGEEEEEEEEEEEKEEEEEPFVIVGKREKIGLVSRKPPSKPPKPSSKNTKLRPKKAKEMKERKKPLQEPDDVPLPEDFLHPVQRHEWEEILALSPGVGKQYLWKPLVDFVPELGNEILVVPPEAYARVQKVVLMSHLLGMAAQKCESPAARNIPPIEININTNAIRENYRKTDMIDPIPMPFACFSAFSTWRLDKARHFFELGVAPCKSRLQDIVLEASLTSVIKETRMLFNFLCLGPQGVGKTECQTLLSNEEDPDRSLLMRGTVVYFSAESTMAQMTENDGDWSGAVRLYVEFPNHMFLKAKMGDQKSAFAKNILKQMLEGVVFYLRLKLNDNGSTHQMYCKNLHTGAVGGSTNELEKNADPVVLSRMHLLFFDSQTIQHSVASVAFDMEKGRDPTREIEEKAFFRRKRFEHWAMAMIENYIYEGALAKPEMTCFNALTAVLESRMKLLGMPFPNTRSVVRMATLARINIHHNILMRFFLMEGAFFQGEHIEARHFAAMARHLVVTIEDWLAALSVVWTEAYHPVVACIAKGLLVEYNRQRQQEIENATNLRRKQAADMNRHSDWGSAINDLAGKSLPPLSGPSDPRNPSAMSSAGAGAPPGPLHRVSPFSRESASVPGMGGFPFQAFRRGWGTPSTDSPNLQFLSGGGGGGGGGFGPQRWNRIPEDDRVFYMAVRYSEESSPVENTGLLYECIQNWVTAVRSSSLLTPDIPTLTSGMGIMFKKTITSRPFKLRAGSSPDTFLASDFQEDTSKKPVVKPMLKKDSNFLYLHLACIKNWCGDRPNATIMNLAKDILESPGQRAGIFLEDFDPAFPTSLKAMVVTPRTRGPPLAVPKLSNYQTLTQLKRKIDHVASPSHSSTTPKRTRTQSSHVSTKVLSAVPSKGKEGRGRGEEEEGKEEESQDEEEDFLMGMFLGGSEEGGKDASANSSSHKISQQQLSHARVSSLYRQPVDLDEFSNPKDSKQHPKGKRLGISEEKDARRRGASERTSSKPHVQGQKHGSPGHSHTSKTGRSAGLGEYRFDRPVEEIATINRDKKLCINSFPIPRCMIEDPDFLVRLLGDASDVGMDSRTLQDAADGMEDDPEHEREKTRTKIARNIRIIENFLLEHRKKMDALDEEALLAFRNKQYSQAIDLLKKYDDYDFSPEMYFINENNTVFFFGHLLDMRVGQFKKVEVVPKVQEAFFKRKLGFGPGSEVEDLAAYEASRLSRDDLENFKTSSFGGEGSDATDDNPHPDDEDNERNFLCSTMDPCFSSIMDKLN